MNKILDRTELFLGERIDSTDAIPQFRRIGNRLSPDRVPR